MVFRGGDMVLFGLGEWNRWVYFVSLFDFFFFFFLFLFWNVKYHGLG